jgi:endonuclease/exonuclease/phosphatase family metal-dependent hydrolase
MAKFRVASFNVENLFERAKALNLPDRGKARPVLERHASLNALLDKDPYSANDKIAILKELDAAGLKKSDEGGKFFRLRQVRRKLLKRPAGKPVEVVASGRSDWVGWVELKTETVNAVAMENTARVIDQVDADILAVVEAENRIALDRFSAFLLDKVGGKPYPHVMVIDGNDDRGIDVGLLTKSGYDVVGIRSHVDDTDAKGEIFSRDCPEYTITTPAGKRVVVLVNHFKSKGYSRPGESSNTKRERQAKRVAKIYKRLISDGEQNVVVVGDLNDTPQSAPLAPLIGQTDLRDISEHPKFTSDGRPGTYANGTKSQKIDYVLLSPALFGRVKGGKVFREGVWGGKNGDLFPHFPEITKEVEAASDHAAICADLDL